MRIHIKAPCSIIGSKKLDLEVKEKVLVPSKGKKMLEVTLVDDNGNEAVFTVPLRLFKTGTMGGYLVIKGEGRIIELETPAKIEKEQKNLDSLSALTSELLS